MKTGDVVDVRIDRSGEDHPDWLRCKVIGKGPDGTLRVKVECDDHKFRGKTLTVDADHIRAAFSS